FEAACELLDTARIPITAIAAALGYAETSAFSRAFRRWSGATPVQRRQGSRRTRAGSRAARPARATRRDSESLSAKASITSTGPTDRFMGSVPLLDLTAR